MWVVLLFLLLFVGVVCHIKYLAWCVGCTVDYWCLMYTLFGLVLLYIWFTVDWGIWTVDLVVVFVIYIIWLSVVYHIHYLA